MWTTDQKLASDRPPHGHIRTLDKDYNFLGGRVDGLLTMDRHGRIRTTDHGHLL